ncbi:MAG: tRNA1(Val) (adenine(37)-N6)-methyltransferase [Myxococcales bacterium]|nr:tRNA1(Val) (adenine(37)-N6)-methyltransferase [Myxococcales bacterium]
MPNPFFHFKQFTVSQDRCAMKVGTDGVLLGAWAAIEHCKRILDVGTGTGLIALMLAQRAGTAEIDALEVDPDAALQARENVAQSPWASRIRVISQSWQSWYEETTHRYDLILSNPPFFVNSSKSNTHTKRLARHDDSLPFDDLLQGAAKLLSPTGHLALVYPTEEAQHCIEKAEDAGWFVRRRLLVFSVPYKPVRRVLFTCSREAGPCEEESLVIEQGARHDYTEAYRALTRDFYLKF